jgi:AcrR family transcriptional regulator
MSGEAMAERVAEISVEERGAVPGLRVGAADQAAAEAMQRRIVETAERLFRQYGYQKTTVADIAAELGMSPANVYRFFASKAAIIEAVARRVTTEVGEQIREAISEPGLSARERLRRYVHVTTRAIIQRCISDNRLHAMVHVAIEQNWGVIQAHKENLRRMIAEVIADGVRAGEFDVKDIEIAAQCFQAATVSCCHPVLVEHRLRTEEDIEASIEPLLEFAFRGLGVDPSSDR